MTELSQPQISGLEDRSLAMRLNKELAAGLAQSDILSAIAVAHAQNRKCQNAELERHLVALRAQAFASLPHNADTVTFPPPADPFPEIAGIPEIAGRDLTPAILAGGILHHGSLLVRGLVGKADAEGLRSDIDRVFEARRAFSAGAPIEQTNPWYAPLPISGPMGYARGFLEEHDGIWTADAPRTFHNLIDIFERTGVLALLGEVLRERPNYVDRKIDPSPRFARSENSLVASGRRFPWCRHADRECLARRLSLRRTRARA